MHKNQTTDKYVNHTIYGGKGYVASNVVESARCVIKIKEAEGAHRRYDYQRNMR